MVRKSRRRFYFSSRDWSRQVSLLYGHLSVVGFSFSHLLRVFSLTDGGVCRTGFSIIPPHLGCFTLYSALNSTKIFREKVSFHTHLSPCFYSLIPSQNIFFFASLVMYLKYVFLYFYLSFLWFQWKDHSEHLIYHTSRKKILVLSKILPLHPFPFHCSHIRQLLASSPQNSLTEERSKGRREQMGIEKVERPVD